MNSSKYNIPFNKPHLTGNEISYIQDAVSQGKLSGNGKYTEMCQNLLEERFGFGKCLLTTSCTDALEMAAILLDIKEGDEVIMPSYTFVSTANAFVLRGAKIIFADSRRDCPNIDENRIEELITSKTKAIVPVHYSGVACNMDKIMGLATKYGLFVVEDAAQAIDSYYLDSFGSRKVLGKIGHLAAFSFHETKNINCGEGGMLVINDSIFEKRAEVIWEKGTNRSAFFRNEVNKYQWIDIGSSFLPSEITAAFLYAQLEKIDTIQKKRIHIWNTYQENLNEWGKNHEIQLPHIPKYSSNNGHSFYLVTKGPNQREIIINYLKANGILAIFHYLSLHKSPFYGKKHGNRVLPKSDVFSDSLIRLPLFYDLTEEELQYIIQSLVSIPL